LKQPLCSPDEENAVKLYAQHHYYNTDVAGERFRYYSRANQRHHLPVVTIMGGSLAKVDGKIKELATGKEKLYMTSDERDHEFKYVNQGMAFSVINGIPYSDMGFPLLKLRRGFQFSREPEKPRSAIDEDQLLRELARDLECKYDRPRALSHVPGAVTPLVAKARGLKPKDRLNAFQYAL